MAANNEKVTVSFETTEANYQTSPNPYKDISLSGPIDIFATADYIGTPDSSPTYDEYNDFLNGDDDSYDKLTEFLSSYSGKVALYSWAFDRFIELSYKKESTSIIVYVDDVREIYENKDHRGAYFRLLDVLDKKNTIEDAGIDYCVWQEVLLGTHSHDNISTLNKLSEENGVLMMEQPDGTTKAVGCGSCENSAIENLKDLLPESFKNAKAEWDKPDAEGFITAPDGTKIYEPLGTKPYHLDARLSELVNTYDWAGVLDNNAAGSCRDLYLELIKVNHRVFIDRDSEDDPWKISLDKGTYEIAISSTNVSFNGENEALQAIYSSELQAYILKFPFSAIDVNNDEFFVFSDSKIIKEINNGKIAYKILKDKNKDKFGLLTVELRKEAINQLSNKEYSEITILCVHDAKKEPLFRPLFEQQFDIGGDLDLETIRTQLLEFYAKNKIIAKPKFPQLFLSTDESGNIQWTNTFTPAQRFYSAQKTISESEKAGASGNISINFPVVYFDPTEDFPLVMNDQAYEYTAKVVAKGDNSVDVIINKDNFAAEGNSIITLIIIKSGAGKSLADELADKYISKADAIKILSKGTLNINDFLTKKAADKLYARKEHTHSEYALKTHNHDERYANFYHTHPEIIREVLRYIKDGISDEDIDKINKEIISNYKTFYDVVINKFNTLDEMDVHVRDSVIIGNINDIIRDYNDKVEESEELTLIKSEKPTLKEVLVRLTELIDRSTVTTDEVLLKKSIRVNLVNGPVGGISENKVYKAGKDTLDDILRDILDPYYSADDVKKKITPVLFDAEWYIKEDDEFKKISIKDYQRVDTSEMHILYFTPIMKNAAGGPCEFKYIGNDNKEWGISPDFEFYVSGQQVQPEKNTRIYKLTEEAVLMDESTILPTIEARYYNVPLVDSRGDTSLTQKDLISPDEDGVYTENGKLYKVLYNSPEITIDEPDFYYGWAAEDATVAKPSKLNPIPKNSENYHIFGGYFNNGFTKIKPLPNESEPVIYIALEDLDNVNYKVIDSSAHDDILPYFELANTDDLIDFEKYTVRKYHVYFDTDDDVEFNFIVKKEG